MYALAVAVRATVSVTISMRGWSGWISPCQISTKPVLCAITTSTVRSACGRKKPVSCAALRTNAPSSSTIHARLK